LARVQSLFQAKDGMILVTGPTGSGKTTTLYTALGMLRSEGVNIVTVEDPVEYRLDGITQVQTNERAGLTFASALRSILRQDPDVVLVGEVRDTETAEIAIRASLTGHLVLSTLHTNDAPSTIMRLVDMGVDVQALGGALRGVMAQRLLRRLCEHCRIPIERTSLAVAQQTLLAELNEVSLFDAVGCPECDHVGYKGRLVVPEIVQITTDLERAIADQASPQEILLHCYEAGMVDLWHAGLKRVALGLTSLNELLDNIAPPTQVVFDEAPQEDVDAIFTAHVVTPQLEVGKVGTWMPGPPTPFLSDQSEFVLIDNSGKTPWTSPT
jgi:type IV pilus assembly protein PilB